MIRRLIRQRRRIFIFSISAALAAMLLQGASLLSLVCLGVGLLTACIIILVAPAERRIIECMALTLPFAAALPLHDVASPFVLGTCTLILYMVLYGRWADFTPLRLRLTSRRNVILPASAADVWQKLIPGEAAAEEFWDPTLIDFEFDKDNPLVLRLRRASPSGVPVEGQITFLSKIVNLSCRYIHETNADDLPKGVIDESVTTVCLTPQGRAVTLLESERIHHALPIRLALARWLDDDLGDEWDSFSAKLAHKRDSSINGFEIALATQQSGR